MEPSEEPVTIATDGVYPTPGNQKLAETKNVHIVSTNMSGKKANDFYAGFKLSDDGKTILACPGGIEPVSAMVLKPCPRACGGTTTQTNSQGDGCEANYSSGSKSVH